MEFGLFDLDIVSQVIAEDRLSRLPDELIHKILFCLDMKFAVETCVLSSRWEFVWTSMPCLNFSSGQFRTLPKFAQFVTDVLSHRNHQAEVSSVKLDFHGAADEVFVRKIADYAYSHNVQELSVTNTPPQRLTRFPPSLFSSQTLKHFTLIDKDSCWITLDTPLCFPALTTMHLHNITLNIPLDFPVLTTMHLHNITLNTPWDFPALTTMHLINMKLCGDLLSKCVNLKNLTLDEAHLYHMEVLDIITPQLSNLMLNNGSCSNVINMIAPQLENLTIIDRGLEYLNAPPLSENWFYSVNKVTIRTNIISKKSNTVRATMRLWEGIARKTIRMLQPLHSARHLTLSAFLIQCLSSSRKVLSSHSSPFSNLISLTIDSRIMRDGYKVGMSTEATKFFLEKSPDATIIQKLSKAGGSIFLNRLEVEEVEERTRLM